INDIADRKSRWSLYLKKLLLIYLGNFIGAVTVGLLALLVAKPAVIEFFQNMSAAKASAPLLTLFAKGILCNILVCIAILLYRQTANIALLFIPIFVFVLSGFEHSIADMFVFTFAPNTSVLLPLLIITLGNFVGGAVISLAYRYIKKP
ncbi:MAG: formate/nitrite transporter family protein, partial [Candidatus Nomurabacteria bacterium]|nr:formate/nitrite transporter family protein [Candidatus Nomurabacteria bacterium]